MTNTIFPRLAYFFKFILPSTIGVSFIVSMGPQIQLYLLSFLNSEVPSIYGSAYKDQLIEFPSLRQWAEVGLNWNYMLMAAVIIGFSLNDPKPRTVLWRSAISSFFVLTCIDFGYAILNNMLTVKYAAENIIGNLVGGVFLSALVVVFICMANFLYVHIPTNKMGKTIAAAVAVMSSGFLFLCLTYYLADLLYHPLSVRIEAHLSAPLSGDIVYKRGSGERLEGSDSIIETQSLVPDKRTRANATWSSPEGHQKIVIHRLGVDKRYSVSINLLSGWCTPEDVKKLNLGNSPISMNGIEQANISFDHGMSIFQTINADSSQSKFALNTGNISMFWLEQDADKKKIQLTNFVSEGATAKISNSDKEQVFLLSAPVMKIEKEKSKYTPRFLSVKLDEKSYLIKFSPPIKVDLSKRSECTVIPVEDVERAGKLGQISISVNDVNMFVNAFVKIVREDSSQSLNSSDTELFVSGGGGWFKLDPIEKGELDNHKVGTLEMIQVKGNITDLAFDNIPIAARPLSTYTAVGEFTAVYGEEGKLVVSGFAKSLWKDGGRLNMTKWEKLAWEPMVFILGVLISATGWISMVLAKCLRNNTTFDWLI
jgi:hypothetical protein